MLKVGLTGNIGSGKSTVAQVFSVLEIPVYHADEESKRFLHDLSVLEKIRESFGEVPESQTGEVDRVALGRLVFGDPIRLSKLTHILHPLVIEDFKKWCRAKADSIYVILEAAIIFESGVEKNFDKIVHVSCPEEVAIQRVMERDRTTREEILKRMQFQLADDEKARRSDWVINNDGTVMLIPQVLELHQNLIAYSSGK
jgi:dephospho-CoA kinase